jgi:hypothetical protein
METKQEAMWRVIEERLHSGEVAIKLGIRRAATIETCGETKQLLLLLRVAAFILWGRNILRR